MAPDVRSIYSSELHHTSGKAHFGRTAGPDATKANEVLARLPKATSATRSACLILPVVTLDELKVERFELQKSKICDVKWVRGARWENGTTPKGVIPGISTNLLL